MSFLLLQPMSLFGKQLFNDKGFYPLSTTPHHIHWAMHRIFYSRDRLKVLTASFLISSNIIEIEGLLFLGFGPMRVHSMENWFFQFFPSRDITRVLKNGAL